MRIFNRRNNNGTTTTEPNALVQSGWIGLTFSGSATNINGAITFPVAYNNIPIVNVTFGGDQSSGTVALGNGANTIKLCVAAKAVGISTTGFTAYIYTTDSTSYASGNIVYAHWTAIGN